jgi:cyclomaltodextrinase / maltogenic alpha-amylase / neopullulanase
VNLALIGSIAIAATMRIATPSRAGWTAMLLITIEILATSTVASAPACVPPALGDTVLYMRGTMNNWEASRAAAFQYRCDAYYLDVAVRGPHEFKIADGSFSKESTFGARSNVDAVIDASSNVEHALGIVGHSSGAGNLLTVFRGPHSVRVAFPTSAAAPTISIAAAANIPVNTDASSNPIAASVVYDSRDPSFKRPFGASKPEVPHTFVVTALPGASAATLVVEKRGLAGSAQDVEYSVIARVPMKRSAGSGMQAGSAMEHWQAQFTFSEPAVYGYYFEIEINGETFVYQNNPDAVFWTREVGTNGRGTIESLPRSRATVRRFRLTIYRSDFRVPEWASDAVYYHIFPDRFRNGDLQNDPRPGRDRFADGSVEIHRKWLEKPYWPGTADGSDGQYNNDFFGGDLRGITDKLDYIAGLGANTIYLTPIFVAASNHKYDTADYSNVDPHLGTNADFTRLTAAAAKRGIRILLDTSLNHTGSDSIYFDLYARRGGAGAFSGGRYMANSAYADWYHFDTERGAGKDQYQGWIGLSDLPELNKQSPTFRRFAYGDHDSIMQLWLDRGAAGWRMDVAAWVPDDFWREWRRAIKQRNPNALLVGEVWFEASKFLLGEGFDSTMNYIFRSAVLDYASGASATDAYPNIELLRELYPPQAFAAMMNMLSSHDAPRALYHLGYRNEFSSPAALALAKQRLRLAAFFQMTFPGGPTVYYGDEVGVAGGFDPYNRGTYPWSDLGGHPDNELLREFKSLIKLRADNPVLRHGTLEAPLLLTEHVIALVRHDEAKFALTITNNAQTEQSVDIELPDYCHATALVDARTGAQIRVSHQKIHVNVPPLYGRLLIGA